jgi:hypothetical protein
VISDLKIVAKRLRRAKGQYVQWEANYFGANLHPMNYPKVPGWVNRWAAGRLSRPAVNINVASNGQGNSGRRRVMKG